MTSAATIKQALGLESLIDPLGTPTAVVGTTADDTIVPEVSTVEEDPLIINEVNVDELVDTIREEAKVNDALVATAEGFTELYNQLCNVSLEAFNESNIGIVDYAVDLNFKNIGSTTPAPILEARSEGDVKKALNLSMEAADTVAGKAIEALRKGIAVLIEKFMEIMDRFIELAGKVKPASEAAIKKISGFVKDNTNVKVTLSSSDLHIITMEGKFDEGNLARDITDFAKLSEFTTGPALKALDAFLTAVDLKTKSATKSDELLAFIKEEAKKLSPMGAELLHTYLGGYEARLTNGVFTIGQTETRRQLNVTAEEVKINPRSLSNAVYATRELSEKTNKISRQVTGGYTSREASIINTLGDKNEAEFGNIRPVISAIGAATRPVLMHSTLCVAQSARIITVVMNIAKRIEPAQ